MTMRSAIEFYTQKYGDQLTPKAKQIIARLPDGVFKQVRAAFDAGLWTPGALDYVSPEYEDPRDCRARMRRNEPALDALSDEELDIALDVVCCLGRDGHAAEEAIDATGEYMSDEERERMWSIACWAW